MAKAKLTPQDLDARLKFILGLILGTILLCTTLGILYALIFVTQPITGQSENDKMFFNVLGSVATFITGTLAGLLIGQSGAKDVMAAQIANKEVDAKNTQDGKKLDAEIDEAKALIKGYKFESINIPSEKDAEKFGTNVRGTVDKKIDAVKNLFDRNTNKSEPPPPSTASLSKNIDVTIGYKGIPGYMDSVSREFTKNPALVRGLLDKNTNEYT